MQGHIEKAKVVSCWGLLMDDITNITILQQFIFFVPYVHKSKPKTFLDIHLLDTGCATATNIYKIWKQVVDDDGLDVKENIANMTDGAHTMVRAHNSPGQKIKAANDMHCSAH